MLYILFHFILHTDRSIRAIGFFYGISAKNHRPERRNNADVGKEAKKRKQAADHRYRTLPIKDKHCVNVYNRLWDHG